MNMNVKENTISNLSEHIIDNFKAILKTKHIPINIRFSYLNDTRQKNLIRIKKNNKFYSFLLKTDLLVTVNELIYNAMDENTINILFEQEIDKIYVNIETGVIKLVKPEINTFPGIVLKYGYDVVANANILNESIVKNIVSENTTLN